MPSYQGQGRAVDATGPEVLWVPQVVVVWMLSRVQLLGPAGLAQLLPGSTPAWFSRARIWSGFPCHSPGDLPRPKHSGSALSPCCRVDSYLKERACMKASPRKEAHPPCQPESQLTPHPGLGPHELACQDPQAQAGGLIMRPGLSWGGGGVQFSPLSHCFLWYPLAFGGAGSGGGEGWHRSCQAPSLEPLTGLWLECLRGNRQLYLIRQALTLPRLRSKNSRHRGLRGYQALPSGRPPASLGPAFLLLLSILPPPVPPKALRVPSLSPQASLQGPALAPGQAHIPIHSRSSFGETAVLGSIGVQEEFISFSL